MRMIDNLIVDVSGMLYRTYYAILNQPNRRPDVSSIVDDEPSVSDPDEFAKFALHAALNSMNKSFKEFKPKRVIACFDRPNNWRKIYMQSDLALSKLPYKGQRRQTMTDTQKIQYYKFLDHMVEFERLLESETGILTLAANSLEADDCIAGWVQRHSNETNVIATGDSDMCQLITTTTKVYDFTSGKLKVCDDPKYFLFEKTVRGDSADNIASTYPRIRATKIKTMYTDEYVKQTIFSQPYLNPLVGREGITVGEAFAENELLMDLTKQPLEIRQLIDNTIDAELSKTKRFNFWKFAAFCTKNNLKNVQENLEYFRPLLLGGYHNVRT